MMKPTERQARRRPRHQSAAVLVLAIIAAVACGGAYLWSLSPPAPGPDRVTSVVRIEKGASLAEIAQLLAARGCLRCPLAFKLYALTTGQADKLQSGTYEISPAMSAPQIIQMLAEGRQAIVTVTVPEGFTIAQIAPRLAEVGLADEQQFRAAATAQAVEETLKVKLPNGVRSAEGYLFPETYSFTLGTTAGQIVARTVKEFETRFVKGPWQMPDQTPWGSLHDIVTLASLVEKEARLDTERALIAGVLRNRLKRGMRLECDATVLYALGEHRARVMRKDLQVDSPYNTYRHPGLPPGPICNPGLACLQAALQPAPTEYLFYVARGDGSHIFSRTYEEHLAAIGTARSETEER